MLCYLTFPKILFFPFGCLFNLTSLQGYGRKWEQDGFLITGGLPVNETLSPGAFLIYEVYYALCFDQMRMFTCRESLPTGGLNEESKAQLDKIIGTLHMTWAYWTIKIKNWKTQQSKFLIQWVNEELTRIV
jgi:hypothetical protein